METGMEETGEVVLSGRAAAEEGRDGGEGTK